MNNFINIVMLAVLVAGCFIFSNILHPINALIIPYQEQHNQTTLIKHVKGHSIINNNITKTNNNTNIEKLPPLQVLNVNDDYILDNSGNYIPIQQSQDYSIINNDPIVQTTSNNDYDSVSSTTSIDSNTNNNNIKSIKTNHDDTMPIVEKMIKEGKLVDGQTVAVPKGSPQQYEDENSEGLPIDDSAHEYEGIVKDYKDEGIDHYVVINGAPNYIDTKVKGQLVDYNDDTHNPIIWSNDNEPLLKEQQDHLAVLGKDSPRSLDETKIERENAENHVFNNNAVMADLASNNNDDNTQDSAPINNLDNYQIPDNIDNTATKMQIDDNNDNIENDQIDDNDSTLTTQNNDNDNSGNDDNTQSNDNNTIDNTSNNDNSNDNNDDSSSDNNDNNQDSGDNNTEES